jgi:hypothetical protein
MLAGRSLGLDMQVVLTTNRLLWFYAIGQKWLGASCDVYNGPLNHHLNWLP